MEKKIRILHLEDSPNDAELISSTLESEKLPCEIVVVNDQRTFEAALMHGSFDLILSDYGIPNYDGFAALKFARQKDPTVPFILLSGTLGEEQAVESLKNGATDYLVKERLTRLGPAIRRALAAAEEVSEREQAQENLRKSEERFHLAARATDDVVWDWDLITNALWWSEAFQSIFRYRTEQIQPDIESWSCRLHPEEKERVTKGVQEAIQQGQQTWTAEYRFLRGDGTYADIFDRGHVIYDAAKKPVRMIGAMMDISDRKKSEERIREQAALLDKAQDAICLNDMSQVILYWNKSAERLYGWTAPEAIGKNANDLLFQGDLATPMNAIVSLIRHDEWKGELNQVTKAGDKLVIESRWTLMREKNGQPKSILVINTDITEKKQTEAKLLRTQRMESIGALAGGIAHDLNNSLAPILMAADMIQDELVSAESKHLLTIMKTSAQRGADMVRQILSFSRGLTGEHAVLQIKHLIGEAVNFARSTFPRSIIIETQVTESLLPVLGDATQINQVLMNLCINARDAMTKGGRLRIEADNIDLDQNQPKIQMVGPHILLRVTDTGTGMPAEVMSKIFEPFFTTKEIGKGTGLGLSTVVEIVKSHRGFLEVSSEVGKGTRFCVYLPAAVGKTLAGKQKRSVPPEGSGELVLIVDDDTAILEMSKLMLEAHNYQIVTAQDGPEAIACFKKRHHEIKAVVTDMMMPHMNGPELIKKLRIINPSVKIIGMSGLGSEAGLSDAGEIIVHAFLKKPFSIESLLVNLHKIIAAK